jgi:predicted O-methyltransferase YrrM
MAVDINSESLGALLEPVAWQQAVADIGTALTDVSGWLSPAEIAFLVLAARCPTSRGDILEIGSFRGRSTIALAHAMQPANEKLSIGSSLVAIDPMLDDSPIMTQAVAQGEARKEFDRNLAAAGVSDRVNFHQAYSYDVAPKFNQPLRLLWIDGDHSYGSTKQDFDLFSGHLADGAIIALHDVLARYDGPIRVFLEDILASGHFGAAGLSGSIGWAQYRRNPDDTKTATQAKNQLAGAIQKLLPYHLSEDKPGGLSKMRWKWLRSRVPHGQVDPREWAKQVQFCA